MTATSLELHQLERDKACTRCELHEERKVRCIPTTRLSPGPPLLHNGARRVVLIIGEAPGATEEKYDQPFVGRAGNTLRKLYIGFFKLDTKADVYLGNAVRCRPAGNRTPNKTQMKACHAFLLADVLRLQRDYKEVLVLAVGQPAVSVTTGLSSLTKAFPRQGEFTDWSHLVNVKKDPSGECSLPKPTRVFCTYHPSFVNREPSSGLAVKNHLQLLADHLDGKLDYELPDQLDIAVAPLPPEGLFV